MGGRKSVRRITSKFSGEGFVSTLAGARSSKSTPVFSFPANPLHSTGMPQERVAAEGHNNKEFGL